MNLKKVIYTSNQGKRSNSCQKAQLQLGKYQLQKLKLLHYCNQRTYVFESIQKQKSVTEGATGES